MNPNERAELSLKILNTYNHTHSPMDRRITLEIIIEAWIDSASDNLLRKHALVVVGQLDGNAAQIATGRILDLPEELAEMKHALKCLVILNNNTQAHALIRKMMDAIAVWAIKEDVAETALLIPILARIPIANLRGLERRLVR